MSIIYTAKASATGGREGTAKTDDGRLNLQISRPGGDGAGTNPEQLFAIGYAACFSGAAKFVAQQQKLEIDQLEVKSEVALNKDDGGFSISVMLDVQLPGMDAGKAAELVKATHEFCPYSKATRGNIEVTLKANGQLVE